MIPTPRGSRRDFLGTASVTAGAAALPALLPPSVHAAGGDRIRVGLVGCGGRGSGAAVQALSTAGDVALTAVGDMFADRIEQCLRGLQASATIAAKVDVPVERRFAGFDAYQQAIDSGVDVVLLATPPPLKEAKKVTVTFLPTLTAHCRRPSCESVRGDDAVARYPYFSLVHHSRSETPSAVSGCDSEYGQRGFSERRFGLGGGHQARPWETPTPWRTS